MKRMMMISMLAVLTAVPSVAQYTRRPVPRPSAPTYSRPAAPRANGYYAPTTHRYAATDSYFGLRLGLGVATVNADNPYLDGGSPKAGFNVGVVAGLQVAPATPLYVETGLSYTEKGGKGGSRDSYTYTMNYLEVPLLVKYQYNLDHETSIQPFVGVYGALGVSGKIKAQDQRQLYNSFADDTFKRLDGGLRIGCGLEFDLLYAEVGYDFGLSNVSQDDFDAAHTGCFFANIGINF